MRELTQRGIYRMAWRILLNYAKDAGFRAVMFATAPNLDMAHGPWQGVAWFQKLVEGAQDYVRTATPEDPLPQALGPKRAHEVHGMDAEPRDGFAPAAFARHIRSTCIASTRAHGIGDMVVVLHGCHRVDVASVDRDIA